MMQSILSTAVIQKLCTRQAVRAVSEGHVNHSMSEIRFYTERFVALEWLDGDALFEIVWIYSGGGYRHDRLTLDIYRLSNHSVYRFSHITKLFKLSTFPITAVLSPHHIDMLRNWSYRNLRSPGPHIDRRPISIQLNCGRLAPPTCALLVSVVPEFSHMSMSSWRQS